MKDFDAGLRKLSAAFAVVGGSILVFLVVLIVTSILGRALFSMPVPGDFEIVAVGTAMAVF